MKNFADKNCRESRNTHCEINDIFLKSCRLWDNVEKHCRAGQATDNMYPACALHAGYRRLQIHTLRLCNAYCFPTTTITAARTPLNAPLYVHWLSLLCNKTLDCWQHIMDTENSRSAGRLEITFHFIFLFPSAVFQMVHVCSPDSCSRNWDVNTEKSV